MRTFTTDIYRTTRKGREFICSLEYERESFTAREFKNILTVLFDNAAQGKQNENLIAETKCGDVLFIMRADTSIDGSTVSTDISVARPREKYARIRNMIVAA